MEIEILDKQYEIKKIYYLLQGLYSGTKNGGGKLNETDIKKYNKSISDLASLLNENDILDYSIMPKDMWEPTQFICNVDIFWHKIAPVISYLENMHISTSEYQISKIGTLYTSIEDDELRKRCIDILSGDGAFDRVINQATQVLEDRIKKTSGLNTSNLIGFELVSKAIHSKIDDTILKFSDIPNIQESWSLIFKGVMGVYRNPTHHTLNYECTREEALKCCVYIDTLLKEIKLAQKVK